MSAPEPPPSLPMLTPKTPATPDITRLAPPAPPIPVLSTLPAAPLAAVAAVASSPAPLRSTAQATPRRARETTAMREGRRISRDDSSNRAWRSRCVHMQIVTAYTGVDVGRTRGSWFIAAHLYKTTVVFGSAHNPRNA